MKDAMNELAAFLSLMLFGTCLLVWAAIVETWSMTP